MTFKKISIALAVAFAVSSAYATNGNNGNGNGGCGVGQHTNGCGGSTGDHEEHHEHEHHWQHVEQPGPQGPQGPQGDPGPMGPQGPQGVQGVAGKDGTNGKDGVGVAGSNGINGTNGTNGTDGATGKTGATGANGTDGVSVKKMVLSTDTLTTTYSDGTTSSTRLAQPLATQQSVNQLRSDLNSFKRDTYGGISTALAIGNLPQPTQAGKSMISGGVSTYHGEQGFALGVSRVTSDNRIVMKAGVSTSTSGGFGAAASAGYQW